MGYLNGVTIDQRPTYGKKPTILIVDDIPSHIELMEALLNRELFNFITASNGIEALQVIEESPPDLAIIDVMMPGMDGYELCKRLKALSGSKFLPVIMVTALNELEDKVKGLEAGADDFFSRPFHSVELLTKVRSLLRLRELQKELDHSEDIIITLAIAIEAKDPYTKGHSERVGRLSREFGRFIGLSVAEQNLLNKAGIIHDIGKIGIKEGVLHKNDSLSDNELQLIRQHPVIGENICRPLSSLRAILPAIRHHHERWDGRGYPDGLKADEIPLMARILGIADGFDAIVSERPYRKAISTEMALRKMEVEGAGQWDPMLLQRFIEMVMKGDSER
ncbi:MAG: response regulator [Thermodesulfovibrionia bacterium]